MLHRVLAKVPKLLYEMSLSPYSFVSVDIKKSLNEGRFS